MTPSFSFRPVPRLNDLTWLIATGSALAFAACSGPNFRPCASGSCDPNGEGGDAGAANAVDSAGSSGKAGNAGEGGAPFGNAGGLGGHGESGGNGDDSGGGPVHGQGGDTGGVAGNGVAGQAGQIEHSCSKSEDCDNGDATDGEETCVDETCVSGNAPPRIVSVSPTRSAMDQAPDATIELEFSEGIAPDTLTQESLIVEAGGLRVPGTLSYSDDTVTFTPAVRFPLRGLVTLKVTTSVTDLEGAALLDEFSSGFWVRDGEWSVPEQLDSIAPSRTGRHVPVDASGNVLVTFVRTGEGSNRRAFSRFYHPGVGLSAFVEHSESATPSAFMITAAMNDHGVGSVIWRQSAQFAYGVYSRAYHDGQWTPAPQGRNFEAAQFATAVSPQDEAHFAYGYYTTALTRCPLEGSCTGAAGTPNDGKETFPSFAFDAKGNGIATWRRQESSEGPGGILVAGYSADEQAWKAGTLLTNQYHAAVPTGSQPSLAISPDGQALVVWVEQGMTIASSSGTVTPRPLLASYYDPTEDEWTSATQVSPDVGQIGFFAPKVVFDGTTFVVAWVASEPGGARVYTRRVGDGLIEPQQRRDEAGAYVRKVMPQLATDRAGDLVLTWLEASPNAGQHRLAYQRCLEGVWSPTEYMSELVVHGQVEDATLDPAVQLGVGATGVVALLWEQRSSTTLESLWLSVFE